LRGQVGQETSGPEGGVVLSAGDFVFSAKCGLAVEVRERCMFHRGRQGLAYGSQLLEALIEIVG
jgi:hypothetical protein